MKITQIAKGLFIAFLLLVTIPLIILFIIYFWFRLNPIIYTDNKYPSKVYDQVRSSCLESKGLPRQECLDFFILDGCLGQRCLGGTEVIKCSPTSNRVYDSCQVKCYGPVSRSCRPGIFSIIYGIFSGLLNKI